MAQSRISTREIKYIPITETAPSLSNFQWCPFAIYKINQKKLSNKPNDNKILSYSPTVQLQFLTPLKYEGKMKVAGKLKFQVT